jgi:hypothetical protein
MDLRTANVIRSLANGLLRTLATLHRHQRETAKALPGKGVAGSFETGNLKLETTPTGVPHSRPSASGNNTKQNVTADIRQNQQEPEAARQRDPHPLPGKGVPRTENNDNQTPDWLLKLQEESMVKIAKERGQKEQKTGVPHSRPSASGNNGPQTLPDKGVDSVSHNQLETGNPKLETAPPTPVRDPDNEPSPIPGLLNRHLNYLKFAGMPVPDSQSISRRRTCRA